MTSNEVITILRNRINKIYPSLSFQDKDLWKEFTIARAKVLRNQLSRRKIVSDLAYHKVCLELIDAKDNECCIVDNCTVKRSKYQIPSYLHTSNNSTLQLLNLKNKRLPNVAQEHVEKQLLHNPGYKNKQVYSVVNSYVYIYNTEAKIIQTKAIWSDPLDLLFIQKCKEDCLQDSKELIQLSEELLHDIMTLAMQNLMPSLEIRANKTGDNNEET